MSVSKGGRPTEWLTDEQVKKLEVLAGYGLSLLQICAVLEITEAKIMRRKKDQAVVLQALQRGMALAQGRVGQSLYERATNGDVAAIRWYEMTRAHRYPEERRNVNHTSSDGSMTPSTIQIIGVDGETDDL